MPSSTYDIQSYDAQPVADDRFLLICAGSVKYADSKEPRGFSETFLLTQDIPRSTKYLIATQGFRLVA